MLTNHRSDARHMFIALREKKTCALWSLCKHYQSKLTQYFFVSEKFAYKLIFCADLYLDSFIFINTNIITPYTHLTMRIDVEKIHYTDCISHLQIPKNARYLTHIFHIAEFYVKTKLICVDMNTTLICMVFIYCSIKWWKIELGLSCS